MDSKANIAALILTTLGVILFMAMAFSILPGNYAIFGGIVCFILAGVVKRFMAQSRE